ncbi:MAG: M28 family metallopeptidase, partial [Vicinamibacteria bacterium]|nr:M28 family metallopeptidase [Vicinamibacteria bacterium]
DRANPKRAALEGINVIAWLHASNPETVVIGAHHDTVPGSPGANDDASGVAVLIELARVMAHEPQRPRTLAFVSFDGEESWAQMPQTTVGSRAYLHHLDAGRRRIVAAIAIEMCGSRAGRPTLHTLSYSDPLQPGRAVAAPAWLIEAALSGARSSGEPPALGDPSVSWLYQPAVRAFRSALYGDDLSFMQAGVPAVMISDSSFSRFYSHYHLPSDTIDQLDADTLGRIGAMLVGMTRELMRVPRGAAVDDWWFVAFGRVWDRPFLGGLAGVCLLSLLWQAWRQRGAARLMSLLPVALFALLLWRYPVPSLWSFALPILVAPWMRSWLWRALAFLPFLALIVLGVAAFWRGGVVGVWLAPWEWAVLLLLLLSLLLRPLSAAASRRASASRSRRRGLPK